MQIITDLTQFSGAGAIVALIWILLKLMSGLPRKILEWSIAITCSLGFFAIMLLFVLSYGYDVLIKFN